MDTSLVVLLICFTLSVIVSVGVAAWVWIGARTLLSSAVEACRQLEACVKQRTSMADEVAALRVPLEMAVARATMVIDLTQKATTEMAGNMAAVPKMVEALADIAKRQIEILDQIKNTAQILYTSLHGKGPQRGSRPVDPQVSDQEYEVQELMREHGMGREEALEMTQHDRALAGFRVTR